jgi:molybdate transport system substrate-binding protein
MCHAPPSRKRKNEMKAGSLLLAILFALIPSMATADTVTLYAAGSLTAAMNDIAKAYEDASGNKVASKFGPSGLLKNEIASGATADVFASANMAHPQALHQAGKSGPVKKFARNKLCALAAPRLKVDSDNLLERMLDPTLKLGTSTPKADPSGDYAFEVFRRADTVKPGAQAALEKKALQLTGRANSVAAPKDRLVYGWLVAQGRADIFLTYCTNAVLAKAQNPDQQIIDLPDYLSVGADYGLTVMNDATTAAHAFADFIVSPNAQRILWNYGFSAPE